MGLVPSLGFEPDNYEYQAKSTGDHADPRPSQDCLQYQKLERSIELSKLKACMFG